MQPRSTKLFDRLKTVSVYGLGQSIPILAQLAISLVVIKQHSVALWGEYVELLLWVNFLALFSYFGNKTFLLKTFSETPANIYSPWLSNFVTRGLLFILTGTLIFAVPIFAEHRLLILLWAFLLFYNQSFEILILYQRDFKFNFITELTRNAIVLLSILFFTGAFNLKTLLYLIIGGLFIKSIFYSAFYFRNIKYTTISLDVKSLKNSIPFFIPMVLGTIRTKIDSYYGTIYFTKTDLSQYQIFIGLVTLIQMGASYSINPFLKTFYRISNQTRDRIEKQFYGIGIASGILFIGVIYLVIEYLYDFRFSASSYLLAYLFIATLFVHLVLINQFYKENKQMQVAVIIATTAAMQIVLGYFVIKTHQIEGALAIKTIGQWAMIIALLFLRKKIVKAIPS